MSFNGVHYKSNKNDIKLKATKIIKFVNNFFLTSEIYDYLCLHKQYGAMCSSSMRTQHVLCEVPLKYFRYFLWKHSSHMNIDVIELPLYT